MTSFNSKADYYFDALNKIETLCREDSMDTSADTRFMIINLIQDIATDALNHEPELVADETTDAVPMYFSKAHPKGSMNNIGEHLYEDGNVHYNEPYPATKESWRGRLRSCSYCGSMHPKDVVEAIQNGARGQLADMKYGYPHKMYFDGIPNPHAGTVEYVNDKTPSVAPETTHGKFYVVHLRDATEEEKTIIEQHIGMIFHFDDTGGMRWQKIHPNLFN